MCALPILMMPKTYREFFGGVMEGVDRNILNMTDDERSRMLDHFISTIVRYNGHLPGAVHSVSGTVFNDNTIDHAASRMTVGIDAAGGLTMHEGYVGHKWEQINPTAPNYITALNENLHRIIYDDLLKPAGKALHDSIYEEAVKTIMTKTGTTPDEVERELLKMTSQEILNIGALKFRTVEQVQKLQKTIEQAAYEKIMSIPESERAVWERSTARIKPEAANGTLVRNTAEEEWAAVIAYHVIHSVSGTGRYGREFHGILVDALNSEVLPTEADLAAEARKWVKKGIAPSHIPAQTFTEKDPFKAASWMDMFKAISETAHEHVLGPIVNRLVREHTFLYEQHLEMEKFEPLIESGVISRENAEMMADKNALMNMIKYVHNPKDKSLFEANMRVFAPFYFAQNQAWRRALRVLREDPGAFEKYMKLCLGITDYVGRNTVGGTPSVIIPGMTFVGNLGAIGATNPALGSLAQSPFNDMMFGLSADPGSVSSIVPTGSETGWSGFLGLLRPSWGPAVTIPIKWTDRLLGISHTATGAKWIDAMLGPVSTNSSTWNDLIPSVGGRNFITLGIEIGRAHV